MTAARFVSRERGQILPMVALLAVALIAFIGLALDVGRLMVAKVQLGRAVDAAALAGTLKLPNMAAAETAVYGYMAVNEPEATVDVLSSPAERQIEVVARKHVDLTFLRVLTLLPGIDLEDPVTVRAQAVAGFGIQPVDVYLAIDATRSMGEAPCTATQIQTGCPIKEAKDAATRFTNILLSDTPGAAYTKVGVGAFRGCYNPPRSSPYEGRERCVMVSQMVTDLSTNKSYLNSRISGIWAIGHTAGTPPLQPDSGSGTNVCYAMYQGSGLVDTSLGLFGPNGQTVSNTMKILVILSDGDNVYNAGVVYQASPPSPPSTCRPSSGFTQSDPHVGPTCFTSRYLTEGGQTYDYNQQTRERSLDQKAMEFANTLKSRGVEIYVVGFGVCGTNNPSQLPTTSYCNGIGNTDPDHIADRRLLKCIASSTPGTNDHYFEVPTASDLPAVFDKIAREIAFRLLR